MVWTRDEGILAGVSALRILASPGAARPQSKIAGIQYFFARIFRAKRQLPQNALRFPTPFRVAHPLFIEALFGGTGSGSPFPPAL